MSKTDCSIEGWKCPECRKNHFQESARCTTLAYYQPIYKDGVNINPDRNAISYIRHCLECNSRWLIRGNVHDGYGVSECKNE